MNIPDELVQAAAEALKARFCVSQKAKRIVLADIEEVAAVALQAAFAKLPECRAAKSPTGYVDSYRVGWSDAIATLAREFGGQE